MHKTLTLQSQHYLSIAVDLGYIYFAIFVHF